MTDFAATVLGLCLIGDAARRRVGADVKAHPRAVAVARYE
jgi:hypothetical protein